MNLSSSFSKESKKKRKRMAKEEAVALPEKDIDLYESPKKKRRGPDKLNNNQFSSPKTSSDNLETPSSITKKHKKKKKKRRDSESAVEGTDAGVSTEENDTEPSIPPPSPRKKKSKKAANETLDVNNMTLPPMPSAAVDDKSQNDDDQLEIELLQNALEQVLPSKKSYNVQIKVFDYAKLGAIVGLTTEECQTRLRKLIDRTPKVKSLQQVLQETLEQLPFKKKKTSSFSKFIRENKEKIREGMENRMGPNEFAVASALWNDLDDEQRLKYKTSATGKEVGKSPFSIFYENLKSKKPSVTPKKGREKWKALSTEKKLEYIERSMAMMISHKEESKKDEGEDSNDLKFTPGVRCPTKDEALLYLRHKNFPNLPPNLPALMYCQQTNKKFTTSNYLLDALKTFRELDNSEQNIWKKKCDEAWRKYETDVAKWKKKQNSLTLTVLTVFKIPEKQGDVKAGNTKRSKIKEKLARIEMPIGNIKFEDEPRVPPLNATSLYFKELQKKSSEKISFNDARNQYAALDKKSKEILKANVEKIRSTYIKGLLDFVENMPADRRRLFLGLRREKFIDDLKTDIFEEKFPNKDFPVYVRRTESKVTPKKEPGIDYDLDDDILATIIPDKSPVAEKKGKSVKKGSSKSNVLSRQSEKSSVMIQKSGLKRSQSDLSEEETKSESESESSSDDEPTAPVKKISSKTSQKQVKVDSDSTSEDSEEYDSWMGQMGGGMRDEEDSD